MQKPHLRPLLCAALLAAAAVTAASGAADLSGFPATTPGKTTVGVQTADISPDTLSFTVPLYVTVAAVEQGGVPTILAPDNYVIRNTSPTGSDGAVYPEIAVTGVTVESVAGGTWSLKETPTQQKELGLTIGSLPLPEVSAGSITATAADLTAADSDFFDLATGQFSPILGGPASPGLNLPIEGKLATTHTVTEEKTAAQFKVKYTLSLLDADGNPIGVIYDGPGEDTVLTPEPTPTPTPTPVPTPAP